MDTNQIYTLVNNVVQQGLGRTDISVADTSGLVSLGNTILSSSTNTEAFLNTLTQMIGRTIFSYRRYKNKMADMMIQDFEYGAILRKISFQLSSAIPDPTFQLVDGQSIDQWKVSKPKPLQKLFVSRTPYMYQVTIQRTTLREAFRDASGVESLIGIIMGQMMNSIELSMEQLGRATQNNFIAESAHTVDLLAGYNTESGKSLTPATAILDDAFLRYAVGEIQMYSRMLTDFSNMYNDGSIDRFTPKEDQRLRVLSKFESRLETVVQWNAYHDELVRLDSYKDMNYWQDPKQPSNIAVKRASDGGNIGLTNIVAVLHDRDALGIYKKEQEVNTTPLNAAARYYNTFWHEQQLWFNDLSENFIVFTLGQPTANAAEMNMKIQDMTVNTVQLDNSLDPEE